MKIRQLKIVKSHEERYRKERIELEQELAKVPDRDYIRLKAIADGTEHYQEL